MQWRLIGEIAQKKSAADRMSFSAVVERGLILHSKGKGWLFQVWSARIVTEHRLTHVIRPLKYSREGSITLPALSTPLERLKVARIVTAVSQRVEEAMWEPGHNLRLRLLISSTNSRMKTTHFYLRPNPKAIMEGSRISGSSLPSLRNLSGLNIVGSG